MCNTLCLGLNSWDHSPDISHSCLLTHKCPAGIVQHFWSACFYVFVSHFPLTAYSPLIHQLSQTFSVNIISLPTLTPVSTLRGIYVTAQGRCLFITNFPIDCKHQRLSYWSKLLIICCVEHDRNFIHLSLPDWNVATFILTLRCVTLHAVILQMFYVFPSNFQKREQR